MAPLLWVLHLDVQAERTDRRLSVPSGLADVLEDGVHVGSELSDLAFLHLAAPPNLLVTLGDALAHFTLFAAESPNLLLRGLGLPEEARLLARGLLLRRLHVCDLSVGLLKLHRGLVALAARACLGACVLVGDLLLEPCDGSVDSGQRFVNLLLVALGKC